MKFKKVGDVYNCYYGLNNDKVLPFSILSFIPTGRGYTCVLEGSEHIRIEGLDSKPGSVLVRFLDGSTTIYN